MKKLIIILVTAFLLTFNLVIPKTVLAGDPGPPKEEEAKKLVREFFTATLLK